MTFQVPVKQKIQRDEDTKLKVESSHPLSPICHYQKASPYCHLTDRFYKQVIVVGAGLGGLGAAIAILLGGHDVTVLESTSEIAEVLPLIPTVLPFILTIFRSEPVFNSFLIVVTWCRHGV